MNARARIVDEVRAMQDDQRYGHFTHPVMLGLLIAAELLDPLTDWDRPGDPAEADW